MTQYYVAYNGNDGNAGTARVTAWLTLTYALAHISGPGDTLNIDGLFAEDLVGIPNGSDWTTGAFTLMKYPGATSAGITNAGMFFNGNSYIIVDDVDVDNTGHSTQNGAIITNSNHIWIKNSAFTDGGAGNGIIFLTDSVGANTYIYIINNTIQNANGSGLNVGNSAGVYLHPTNISADHIVVSGNTITGCDVAIANWTDFGQAPDSGPPPVVNNQVFVILA